MNPKMNPKIVNKFNIRFQMSIYLTPLSTTGFTPSPTKMSPIVNEVRNKFEIVLSKLFLAITSHNKTAFPIMTPENVRLYQVDKTIFAGVFSSSVLQRLLVGVVHICCFFA